ncbi:unnamed protein product [Amoebophrya sp. A120]|nr:unnamed protein product [Amoebophrya sp. A120]|eukprot:GSA120T00019462001.1
MGGRREKNRVRDKEKKEKKKTRSTKASLAARVGRDDDAGPVGDLAKKAVPPLVQQVAAVPGDVTKADAQGHAMAGQIQDVGDEAVGGAKTAFWVACEFFKQHWVCE